MARTKLFDKIRNQLKPLLTNVDLGFSDEFLKLNIYHPSVLPQESSLIIFDGQTTVDYLSDVVSAKSEELEAIREAINPDAKNLKERKEKVREIQTLNNEISQQIHTYIEALGKLKPGEFIKKVEDLYKALEKFVTSNPDKPESEAYQEFLHYPKEKFAQDIFGEINEVLTEYNQKQLEITAESTTSEKK
jgi:DNA repair ATPase RecN